MTFERLGHLSEISCSNFRKNELKRIWKSPWLLVGVGLVILLRCDFIYVETSWERGCTFYLNLYFSKRFEITPISGHIRALVEWKSVLYFFNVDLKPDVVFSCLTRISKRKIWRLFCKKFREEPFVKDFLKFQTDQNRFLAVCLSILCKIWESRWTIFQGDGYMTENLGKKRLWIMK